ncbi:hypothetical protein Gpo141_00009324 [Globisporangium polare]
MAPSAPAMAMPPLQLTVAETLVPSLLTSSLLFVALASSSSLFAETPLVKRAFFALLPTLLSIAFVQDQRLLQPFKRLFMRVFRSSDPTVDESDAPEVTRALASARAELYKALMDRWSSRKGLGATASTPSMALADHRTPRMRRRDAALSSNTSELLSASTSGKSLYDQVKENLTDHVFQKKTEAPIYFMDPTTGLFLKVNAQHKLVFTGSPDASCLFHVARGKTHHWGFLSAIYQRYIGQNFVGRIAVSSKKLAGWESFRVLQRPDGIDSGVSGAVDAAGEKECSNTIYMILCSSRFGKGMWLAKNRRTSTSFSSSLGPQSSSMSSSHSNASGFSASAAAVSNSRSQSHGARDNIYLSKNFANALALTYASDLSAFEYLANDNFLGGGRVASTSKTSLTTPLPVAMGTTFQPPVLTVSERTHVSLPWIEDPSSKKFFELQEKQMTEVLSITITRCTVKEFLELLVNEEDRKKAQASSGAGAVSGDDKRLCEWHMHPHFGYIRKLSYRPSADSVDSMEGEGALALKTIAIDQYHSCIVNEKAMDKVTFRSKAYTLSTPYSNCSSIETVFEFQDLVDTVTGGPSPVNIPVMQLRCHTGVYFTRPTMFAALVEKGALQGVRQTCDLLLEMAKDGRGRSSTTASTTALSTARQSLTGGGAKTSIPPHTLAMEVIKGIITSFGDAKSLHESFPSLPTKLPWNVYAERRLSRPNAVSAPAAAARLSATSSSSSTGQLVRTSVAFFESSPQQFKLVLEESLGGKITPQLFYESLLSDECVFLHVVNHQSGNMEVDIGAWRSYDTSNVTTSETDPSDQSAAAATACVRLQTFRMPVDGIPSVEIVQVRDFQYHAFVHDEQTGKNRFEFGMKLFVRDLPEGEHYSIEALIHVEMNDGAPSSILRVFYAIPDSRVPTGEPSTAFATIEISVHQGLRAIWKQVALTMVDASQPTGHLSFFQSYQDLSSDQIKHRLQSEGKLPSHDELASKLIAVIASAF